MARLERSGHLQCHSKLQVWEYIKFVDSQSIKANPAKSLNRMTICSGGSVSELDEDVAMDSIRREINWADCLLR